MANKISDGNQSRTKLGNFIEEQGPQVLRVLGRGPLITKA